MKNFFEKNKTSVIIITIAVLIIGGFLYLKNLQKPAITDKNIISSPKIYRPKPEALKEGQCVIQVLGTREKLLEKAKAKCRILVILDKDGIIEEIIEKDK